MKQQYIYNATVTNVVDGDTVDATVQLGFTVSVNVRFRLKGIDTEEMNDPNVQLRESARAAKQRLTELVLNKPVLLKSHKTDKYGRWLADIYLSPDKPSVSELLVAEGLAKVYNG
jgi:micrococcal nuclease